MAEVKPKSVLEKILAIKALLFDNALPTTYQLADGTEVSISLLDVGGDFTIAGTPAPEGTYSLQDGTSVVVDSTGKITSVTAPDAMAASTEYTLADGTKISADKMEAGGKVMQGNAPIANGEYTLADGSKITTVDGAITVVTPKPAEEKMEEEPAPADPAAMTPDAIKALIDERVNGYRQGIESQFSAKESEVVKLRQEVADQKILMQSALELMTEFAQSPSADPPEGVRKVAVFNGEFQKGKKKALDGFIEAAGKIAEQSKN